MVVRHEQENRLRVPIHTLVGIVCFGQVSCSPPLMGLCAEKNVALSFLTEHGRFLARVQGPVNGNVLLRREQYRKSDEEQAAASIARAAVMAKVANCRTVVYSAGLGSARMAMAWARWMRLLCVWRGCSHHLRRPIR